VEGRLAPAKEKHTQLRVSCREAGPAAARDPGGGAMVEVELSWAWAWACSKIVVVEGIIIQDPSSFSTALLDLPFRTREATGHKAGMRWARGRSWTNHRPRMRQRKVQRPNKPQSRSHFSKSRQSLREPATALPTLPMLPTLPTLLPSWREPLTMPAACCTCFGMALTRRERFKERTSAACLPACTD
jgi:hypothetical protein